MDNTFPSDLIGGLQAEAQFMELLKNSGNTGILKNEAKETSELIKWDIQCTNKKGSHVRFEIKWDKMSTTTGNLALEFFGRSKPSGIDATTADYFVFLTGDEFFIYKTDNLKKMVRAMNFRSICINNGTAYCYLMPISKVREYTYNIVKNIWR